MRSVILHLAMKCDENEAAARLMKVNGDMSDTGLRSALILEQTALLYGQTGSARKSAFHMVLAGHTFNKVGLKRLALRCYSAVVDRYDDKRWLHITDHFHFTMARQAFGLGLLPESLHHFVTLLNSFKTEDKRENIQADRETTYLKEFLFVVKNWVEKCCQNGENQIVHLQIPAIGPEITVSLEGDLLGAAECLPAPSQPSEPAPPPPAPLSFTGGTAAAATGSAAAAVSPVVTTATTAVDDRSSAPPSVP